MSLPDARLGALVARFLDEHLAGERADRVLARLLRSNPELSSEERRHVAERTLGVALWRGRLDTMAEAERALWLPLFLIDRERRSLDHVVAWSGLGEARLSRALRVRDGFVGETPAHDLAFRRSFPVWLARRWIEAFGTERADALAAATNERGPVSIRANTLRIDRDALRKELAAEGIEATASTLAPHALRLAGRPNINGSQSWRGGLFEVQDEGSQLIAAAVEAQSGQLVVDLCAGSGGKALALAAAMRNEGRILAIDIDGQRLEDLRARAQRNGVACIEARQADATTVEALTDLRGQADRVLIDAPCTETGTLRRGPDARWRLLESDFEQWNGVQRRLLAIGAQFVKPGGRLVYATCSLDQVENEDVARSLGSRVFAMVAERRTWPDVDGCDGFYWAVWQKALG